MLLLLDEPFIHNNAKTIMIQLTQNNFVIYSIESFLMVSKIGVVLTISRTTTCSVEWEILYAETVLRHTCQIHVHNEIHGNFLRHDEASP